MFVFSSKAIFLRIFRALIWRIKRYLPLSALGRLVRFFVRIYRNLVRFFVRAHRSVRWRAEKYLSASLRRRLKRLEGKAKTIVHWSFKSIQNTYDIQGIDVAIAQVEQKHDPILKSKAYKNLARCELCKNVLSAENLAELSLRLDDSPDNRLRNCMTLWDAGSINKAYVLLQTLDISIFNKGEAEKALQIEGSYRLFQTMPVIPDMPDIEGYEPNKQKILYVASSSRPYHLTGYTSRTHHLLESLREEGWDVHCVTRPGYPFDRPDTRYLDEQQLHDIDGITYERLEGCHRREVPYDEYLTISVDRLVDAALRIKPAVIHAASNYEAALPALIAARRLGVSFCYEVRGLWEFTAASKKPGWEQTERFWLDRQLETHTARHADAVFTLTKALTCELANRGVAAEKIRLLPNAVNLSFFKPLEYDHSLAETLDIAAGSFVCGYIGSVVAYEGLDDLATAWMRVVECYPESRLLIVGDGDELDNIKQLAQQLGLDGQIIFAGRVGQNDVRRYFSLLNAIALPRKPLKVCKLVSPLKPFEAMAMKVPLVVSDVEALGEIIEDGRTGLLHKAGDSDSLAEALLKLASDKELQRALGDSAYSQVCLGSQWCRVIVELSNFYNDCGILKRKIFGQH